MMHTDVTGIANRSLVGMPFTTYDQDNAPSGNCGLEYGGGWWFNECYMCFLNGPWDDWGWGWPWYPTVTEGVDIRGTLMMIRANYEGSAENIIEIPTTIKLILLTENTWSGLMR